jgi:hypothetical protein
VTAAGKSDRRPAFTDDQRRAILEVAGLAADDGEGLLLSLASQVVATRHWEAVRQRSGDAAAIAAETRRVLLRRIEKAVGVLETALPQLPELGQTWEPLSYDLYVLRRRAAELADQKKRPGPSPDTRRYNFELAVAMRLLEHGVRVTGHVNGRYVRILRIVLMAALEQRLAPDPRPTLRRVLAALGPRRD